MKVIYALIMVSVLSLTARTGFGAEAAVSAGIIASFEGDVFLVSSGSSVTVQEATQFWPGDMIRTGKNGSAGLIFRDDTVVSLGASSEIVVEDFHFNPRDEDLSFISRLLKGTFSFVTGQIGKLAPKKVKIQTPTATLGVRGTKFLVQVD